MLLPKGFLGSPSDQHLCFLWVIIYKKQHKSDNKSTPLGNTVSPLCLTSRNMLALTQTLNGGSRPMTSQQEAWVLPSVASSSRFGWYRACRLTISTVNLHGRKWSIKSWRGQKNLQDSEARWHAVCPAPPCVGDTSQCYFPLMSHFPSPSSIK